MRGTEFRMLRPVEDVPLFRGPWHYLLWLTRSQAARVSIGAVWGVLWMVCLMLPPYVIARAIDDGLRGGELDVLAWWAAAIVGVGALNAVLGLLRHRAMTFVRMFATFQTSYVVVRHTTRVGAPLARKVSTGEVAVISGADVGRISQTLTIAGPGVGAAVAYVAVAVLLLTVSPVLGVIVILGVPVLAVLVGPLLNRLEGVESTYREQQGRLTDRAGDIVGGLRVLAGFGGKAMFARRYRAASERLREEGYRVGAITSWVGGLAIGLPSVFLAVVVWLGARMAAAGEITIGELVAVYGYLAVLVTPVQFLISSADDLTRGLVSARRVVALLGLRPHDDDEDRAGENGSLPGLPAPEHPAALHDAETGLTVPPGAMVGVASADPGRVRTLLDPLGGYTAGEVTWGTDRLDTIALDQVRQRILVADHDAYLFAGTVREMVTPSGEFDEAAVRAALRVAAAEDVVGALPDDLETVLDAQARTLSGGQRQRLRLARAVLAAPEVLLLDDPTSAVDAHTEALIAQRMREARQGRTTVVATTSPLLLAHADVVAYLEDGRVAATGSHGTLLRDRAGYRRLVLRGDDTADDDTVDGSATEGTDGAGSGNGRATVIAAELDGSRG